MTIRVGINGLGRIGRCIIRALMEDDFDQYKDIEIVAANGPASLETHAHLLTYDSIHATWRNSIMSNDIAIVEGGLDFTNAFRRSSRAARGVMHISHERDISKLDWGKYEVDVVLECTGKFIKKTDAAIHLQRGAKKVLISAPSPDADATIVYGVNNAMLKPEHKIISAGSCTTNCLAPVAKVMHEAVGIESGFMTTIHSYTGDQNLVDNSHKDLRRARAATLSMIPTSTGAAKAIGLVLPELAGKLNGTSVRVPTPNVSLVDLTFLAQKDTSKEELNKAAQTAAGGSLENVLGFCTAPLVSTDFNHSPLSAIFDATSTFVTNKRLCRVASWYDNEWAFSCRMLDVVRLWA